MNPNQPSPNQSNPVQSGMDQNPQPVVDTTPVQPTPGVLPGEPGQPQQANVTATPPPASGMGKLPLILMAVALLLVIGAGGYYLFLTNTQSTDNKQSVTDQTEELSNMEKELGTLDSEASDSGFTEIDQDLDSL